MTDVSGNGNGLIVRIVLAEDHAILREGLAHLLETHNPGFSIIASTGDGREALDMARVHEPDVVLMDLNLPGMNGIQATRELKQTAPRCKVLILTGYEDTHLVRLATDAGADGYVLKSSGHKELAEAISSVMQDRQYVDPGLPELLEMATRGEEQIPSLLTRREFEVLALVAQGLKSREIGEKLFISVKTVEKHRANVMRKLGMRTASQLAAWAMEMSFLSDSVTDADKR